MNFRRPILLILIAVAFITPLFFDWSGNQAEASGTCVSSQTYTRACYHYGDGCPSGWSDSSKECSSSVETCCYQLANSYSQSSYYNQSSTTTSLAITINLPTTTNQVTILNPVTLVIPVGLVTEITANTHTLAATLIQNLIPAPMVAPMAVVIPLPITNLPITTKVVTTTSLAITINPVTITKVATTTNQHTVLVHTIATVTEILG